ncbi:hypothetical protein ScPMuIL_017535 [Solemya velum]
MDLYDMFDIVAERTDDWYADSDERLNSSLDIDFMKRHPVLSYSYISVIGVFIVIGNIANFMVIGSIITYVPLKTTGNMFIANLALADLCVTAVVGPFNIVGVMKGPRYFTKDVILCHVVADFCAIGCTCSMWTIAAISVNR